MKLHRIYGMFLRYMFGFVRSWDRISDVFYWPTIDLILWGLTSIFFKKYAPPEFNVILMIISGTVFWIILWRSQYEITVNLLEELWNTNLINIFVAPLSFFEWVASFILIGIVKAAVSFTFALGLAYLLYHVQIFTYGFYIIPFLLILIMSGWWVGFLVAGIILRYGTKVQTFAWTVAAVLAPFSAISYPVSVLPEWARTISVFVPTSYVFEGVRQIIQTGKMDSTKIYMGLGLNVVYLVITIIFFRFSFQKALTRGLKSVY